MHCTPVHKTDVMSACTSSELEAGIKQKININCLYKALQTF